MPSSWNKVPQFTILKVKPTVYTKAQLCWKPFAQCICKHSWSCDVFFLQV